MSNTKPVYQYEGTEFHKDLEGSHLVGHLECSYWDLKRLLGKSICGNFDNYKSDVEWQVETPSGIASIYNYKNGKNYCGKDGLNISKITHWHVGGKNEEVVNEIIIALKMLK